MHRGRGGAHDRRTHQTEQQRPRRHRRGIAPLVRHADCGRCRLHTKPPRWRRWPEYPASAFIVATIVTLSPRFSSISYLALCFAFSLAAALRGLVLGIHLGALGDVDTEHR